MVLVKVVPVVCKDDVRRDFLLEALEIYFYVRACVGEKTGLEVLDDDTFRFRALEKNLRALLRFLRPPFVGAEDDPVNARLLILLKQSEDGSSASDLNVIGVSPKTQHIDRIIRPLLKSQLKHGSVPSLP